MLCHQEMLTAVGCFTACSCSWTCRVIGPLLLPLKASGLANANKHHKWYFDSFHCYFSIKDWSWITAGQQNDQVIGLVIFDNMALQREHFKGVRSEARFSPNLAHDVAVNRISLGSDSISTWLNVGPVMLIMRFLAAAQHCWLSVWRLIWCVCSLKLKYL